MSLVRRGDELLADVDADHLHPGKRVRDLRRPVTGATAEVEDALAVERDQALKACRLRVVVVVAEHRVALAFHLVRDLVGGGASVREQVGSSGLGHPGEGHDLVALRDELTARAENILDPQVSLCMADGHAYACCAARSGPYDEMRRATRFGSTRLRRTGRRYR